MTSQRVVYGLSGYPSGYFYNIDISDTTTTAGRNIIAVSALTNELLYGWYHFYTFAAHMKLINIVCSEPCDEICSKFTLPSPTTDQILKVMLGEHYDGYYRLSALRHRIDKLTDNQRKVLYMKNNIFEFYKIPEVKELLRKIIINFKDDNMCIDIGGGALLMSPFAYKPISADIEILMEWVQLLAFGMHYYEGDYVNREYQETMVDIVTHMKRHKVINMDTDSAVSVASHDRDFLVEMFREDIGEEKLKDFLFTDGAMTMLIMTVYLAAIKRALREYGAAINIDPGLIKMLDLEAEICMEQEHLSISKKNYTFTTVVKDFVVKLGKMDSRGFKFKKSDANGALAEQVESDIKSMIMCNIKDLDFAKLINTVHTNTKNTIEMIKTDDFIINKKSVVKIGDINDISWGDTRMKAVRLWDRLYPETPVELPGSFGMIKILITDEMVEEFKRDKTELYKELVKHTEELYKYTIQNRIINKVDQIMDPDDDERDYIIHPIRESKSANLKNVMRNICVSVHGKFSDRDPNVGLCDSIMNTIYNSGLMPGEIKIIEDVFKLPKSKFNPDKEIPKLIDRIAVPIDINTVPELFKEKDYRLLDIEASSEYEHLLSPLLNTTSIAVVKNKSKNAVLTSVLQTF